MDTLITSGVRISVSTQFRQDFSSLLDAVFFFNYRVDILNENEFDIQLISRQWYIFDSLGEALFVEGEGVVGQTPILKPEGKYSYTSACELRSEIGSMHGFYTFKNLKDASLFQVTIPRFNLEYPGIMN